MRISGQLLEALAAIINAAFNRNSLKSFVRTNLDLDIEKDLIAYNKALTDDIKDLIDKLAERNLLTRFIDCVFEERADLQAQLTPLRDALTATAQENTAAITKSVQGMASQLQVAQVQSILTTSRQVLEDITVRLKLLDSFKSLHDALHNVRFNFRALDNTSRDFAKRFEAALEFGQNIGELEKQAMRMKLKIDTLPVHPSILPQKEVEWFTAFQAAVAQGKKAAEDVDSTTARQCVQAVRRILNIQPARIEGILRDTAQAMNLSGLKDVFASAAAVPELASERESLLKGSTAAEQLLNQVLAQVNHHADWQSIDGMLSSGDLIMTMTNPDWLEDFVAMWKGMKDSIAPLIAAEPDTDWAKKLTTCMAKVDTALDAAEPAKLQFAYGFFRQEANTQFFAVDAQLLKLASEVSRIGQPLEALLAHL